MDGQNANKHTQKGDVLLEKSLRELGLGRSILVDKNNNIIAGNGVTGKAAEIGIDKVRFIDTTGNEIVAVRRTDIDINTKEGRAMAIADNQTAAVGIDFDMDVIDALSAEYEIDLRGDWQMDGYSFEPADLDLVNNGFADAANQLSFSITFNFAKELEEKFNLFDKKELEKTLLEYVGA